MRIHSIQEQEVFKVFSKIDWKSHALGEVQSWHPTLVQTLNFVFNSYQPSFVFWGKDAFCFYNDGYIPILGKSKHPTALGAGASQVWGEIWDIDTNPQFAQAMKGLPTWNEDRLVPIERNGKIDEAYFTYGYSPLFSESGEVLGVLVTALETTKTVISRRILDQTAEQLGLALEIIGIGFYDWDMINDKIVFNQKMQSDWGISAGTTLGEVFEFIHPDDRERVQASIDKAVAEKTEYFCHYRILKEGSYEWLDARGLITYEDDKPKRFFGTSMIITEQVEYEQNLQNARLAEDDERALKETVIFALTHDLRTPLTAAKISAQLLSRVADAEKKEQYQNRIISNMDRADQMIRNLLDANRSKMGEILPILKKELDLTAFLKETLEETASLHGDRFQFNAEEAITGAFDSEAIHRILDNLLNNAMKYGDQNQVIEVSLKREKDSALIEVKNKGEVIKTENFEKIFQAYHRTEEARRGTKKGWGLGLTLVRALAEAHLGSVAVQSDETNGTRFTVTLPLH